MITTSPPPGSTINGMVNRTGPHGVSIVKWSGHDCVSISHSWPNDATTRACPTNVHALTRFASSPAVPTGPVPAPPTLLLCLIRIHQRLDLNSRGSTGNRKPPREMLRQALHMRFVLYRIHDRVTTSARLHDRHTHGIKVARISTPLL